jgi:hypothetical protein
MPINQTREVARAEMNDDYGVTLTLFELQVLLTPDEALAFAKEMIAAADEAVIARQQDMLRPIPPSTFTPPIAPTGEAVL